MQLTEDQRFARLDELFGLFVRGEYEEFLAGCSDQLVLNVRGSAGLATIVPRLQIAGWYQAMKHLAGGAFRSSVCFILATEHEAVVVLTHQIDRDGCVYRYQTVNHCTLREGLLAAWFNLPLDAVAYARAWDLQRIGEVQLVSGVR